MSPDFHRSLRRLGGAALLVLLAACSKPAQQIVAAEDFTQSTACSLDGMLLADFPGPKGQVVYADGARDWFCDTTELVAALVAPEQQRRVVSAYTQDMAKADWGAPRGHWIDARGAWYVLGSRAEGGMGPTIATFATQADAQAFVQKNGGRAAQLASITPDMVRMDGGVVQDERRM